MNEININEYYSKLKRQSISICLTIFLLLVFMIIGQAYLQVLNSNSDSLINIAGRQRMLSQKLAFQKTSNSHKLSETLKLFIESQDYLLNEARGNVKDYYIKIGPSFSAYTSLIIKENVSSSEVASQAQSILQKLDDGVQLFEDLSNKNQEIIFYSNLFFMILIVIVLFILYFKILKKQRIEIIENLKNYASERQKANESTQAKSLFLANMSHELRTPLNGIIGIGSLLKDTEMSKEQRDYLNTLVSASVGLKDIINQILDFSKLEASSITIVKKNFSLPMLVQEVQSILYPKAIEKDLYIKHSKPESMPEFVISDPLRLKQVLLNLGNNAIKFTENGGVTFKIEKTAEGVIFEIIDTGIGIGSENLNLIFEDFSQVESTYVKSQEGTGLGLAISQKIVEALGGNISVRSDVNQGTCFSFTLPLEVGEEIDPVKQVQESEEEVRLTGTVGRVLVAEDNKINQIVIRGLLNRLNIEFDFANNGQEAVDMSKDGDYSLILMDISMPILDGFDATRKIREFNQEIIIFCISANVFEDDQKKAMEVGMNEFLEKPIKRNRLTESLNRYFT